MNGEDSIKEYFSFSKNYKGELSSGLYRYTTVMIPKKVGDYFLELKFINPSHNDNEINMVIGSANINLKINKEYTITYNANGGTPLTQSKTIAGGSTLGTLPTVTKDGYTFLGWYTAKTGGTEVTSSTKVTGKVTYYAQWFKPEKLSLVLRANGGKFSDGSGNKITEGTTSLSGGFSYKITESDIPTRSGYTFLGYAKTDSATTANYVVGDMLNITNNTTLYAVWKESSSGGNTGDTGDETDKTGPTISSVTKSTEKWTKGNVILTVTASDASGISGYSFDGGTTYQTSNKKTYSQNTKDIKIKVKDKKGNISTYSNTVSITNIDKEAPSVIANPPLSTLSYQKNLNVQLTVADANSGMQKNSTIYYAWTDSEKQIGSQGLTSMKKDNVEGDHAVTFTIPSPEKLEGEHYLLVQVGPTMDVAGNTFKSNSTTNTSFYECGPYYFDNSAPEITISPEVTGEYTKGGKNITVTATDNGIGLKQNMTLEYAWTDQSKDPSSYIWKSIKGTNEDGAKTASWTIPAESNGDYYLEIKGTVEDKLGNVSSKMFGPYKFDSTAPEITVTPNTQVNYIKGGKDITVTATDSKLGIDEDSYLMYSWSQSADKMDNQPKNIKTITNKTETSVTWTIPAEETKDLTGEYYLWIVKGPIYDNVGNNSIENYTSQVFRFDNSITQPGTIKAQIDNKEYTSEELKRITTDKDVKVILNQGKDNESGIKSTKLEIKKDGNLLTFEGTEVNLEKTGTYKITVTTEDKVGNIAVEEYTIIIQRQPKVTFNPNSTTQVQKKINVKINTENIENSEVYYIYLQVKEGETEGETLSSARNDSSLTWKQYKDTGIELSGLNGKYRIIAKVNLKDDKQIYETSGIYEFDNQVDKVATLSIKIKDENGEDYKDKTTENVYIKINNDAKDKNGVKESYFTIDGKNGKVTDSITLKEKGTYKITVTTVDNLENIDTNKYDVTIEEKSVSPENPDNPNEDEKPNPDVDPDNPNEGEKPNPDVDPDKPNEGEKPNPDVDPDKPNEGEKPNPDVDPDKPNEGEKPNPDVDSDKPNEGEKPNPDVNPDKPKEDEKPNPDKINSDEIPYLGSDSTMIFIAIILVTLAGIVSYINYKKYKNVK